MFVSFVISIVYLVLFRRSYLEEKMAEAYENYGGKKKKKLYGVVLGKLERKRLLVRSGSRY